MIESAQSMWKSLWKSHYQTKRLLKFSQVDKAGEIAASTDKKEMLLLRLLQEGRMVMNLNQPIRELSLSALFLVLYYF